MAVNLTINGRQISAPEGSTILEAARGAGIYIPTLCHHPDLSNIGACRLCVVSVEKARGLQTACTTPVLEGMAVNSESEEARATRRFVLTMLLSDHPNDCMRCEVNGDCELQNLVYEYNVEWPEHHGTRHGYALDGDPNPFVLIDRNKCVLCGRCIRACSEIQGRHVWSFAHRGFKSKLVAGADQPMLEARCESCGQCVAYCPVGALYDKMSVGSGRATQLEKVRTTCGYCGVGCSFDLNVRDGRIVRVTSAPDAPVNGMALCVKGRYGYDFVHHPDRLTRPRVRRYLLEGKPKPRPRDRQPAVANGPWEWVEVDWDTALDIAARTLREIRDTQGPDSIGVLTSAKCVNEENYLMNKFARQVIGTNNIDHCARL
jgi:predicted molibdopterin-dependent oxidoreductase YjgC